MKATASGGSVAEVATQYISDIGTPTSQYLITDSKTVGCGNVTNVTYDTTASFSGFSTSYDESTGCLTLTPNTLTNVARNIQVTTGTGINLTYATGASQATSNTNASFITTLGTVTKSAHSHGFTNPSVALSNDGTASTSGQVAYVQSVADTTVAYEDITNGVAAENGAHGHTISK